MNVDTAEFSVIAGRLDELEGQVAELGQLAALINRYGLGVEHRMDAMFTTLEAMCDAAGMPALRPSRRLLSLVRPDKGGGAA